jgi:hypothetical protein
VATEEGAEGVVVVCDADGACDCVEADPDPDDDDWEEVYPGHVPLPEADESSFVLRARVVSVRAAAVACCFGPRTGS